MDFDGGEMLDPEARLRLFIMKSGFDAGAKLPPERGLTTKLGVSRTSLRKALDALERDGLILRHVGKGTFVDEASTAKPPSNAMVELGRQLTPFRMMRARLAIEPAIAREAAVNASGETLTRMRRTIERAKSATTWAEYEVQDDAFHRAVAGSSDNLLLVTLFNQFNEVRPAAPWGGMCRAKRRNPCPIIPVLPNMTPSQMPLNAAIRARPKRPCAAILARWCGVC